jgi:hypothetical protein
LYGTNVVAFGRGGSIKGPSGPYGAVFLFYWNGSGFSEFAPIYDPDKNNNDTFGSSVTMGSVTAPGNQDLVVGASTVGKVWVFPNGNTGSGAVALLSGIKGATVGAQVGLGDVSGDGVNDLVTLTNWNAAVKTGFIWNGYLFGPVPYSQQFSPSPNLVDGWSTAFDLGDINGDGVSDILVGAPNVSPCPNVSNVGVMYVYLSQGPGNPFQMHTIYEPTPVGGYDYGWSAATIQGSTGNRFFVVGERGRPVGNLTGAGQVYVYKVNN